MAFSVLRQNTCPEMRNAFSPDGQIHLYRYAANSRIARCVLFGTILSIIIWVLSPSSLQARKQTRRNEVRGVIALFAYGVFFLDAIFYRVTLESSRMSERRIFGTRSAELVDITGWQYVAKGRWRTYKIYFKGGKFPIVVDSDVDVDSYFLAWLAQFPEVKRGGWLRDVT